jgi:hypothetical protein
MKLYRHVYVFKTGCSGHLGQLIHASILNAKFIIQNTNLSRLLYFAKRTLATL